MVQVSLSMPQAHTYLLVACGLSLCADGFLTTRPLRHRQVALSVIETDEWLTAQDAEGRTYYYHAVTMETSWTCLLYTSPSPRDS